MFAIFLKILFSPLLSSLTNVSAIKVTFLGSCFKLLVQFIGLAFFTPFPSFYLKLELLSFTSFPLTSYCIRRCTINYGMRLSLLTETHIGIHIRLHPHNINKDNGIEIPEAWMPTIKQHNSRSVPRRTAEGIISSLNDEDQNPTINNGLREDRNAPILLSGLAGLLRGLYFMVAVTFGQLKNICNSSIIFKKRRLVTSVCTQVKQNVRTYESKKKLVRTLQLTCI